ncbi:MAG: CoA transferase [Pseudomonadales bacterium]|nr:CoA transferase [Pseudomonadales bacterium]
MESETNQASPMLKGIKVVELATYMAAPSAAMVLSDWGADTIKIEDLEGDAIRRVYKGISRNQLDGNPMFAFDNRGKRGISVDIRTPEGCQIVRELVRDADIFITNVRPAALDKLNLNYEGLKQDNERLIYATVTGYGLQGEETNRPGFDVVAFWARSGLCRMMMPKGAEPVPVRAAMGDHMTGITLVAGILGALFERERTGKGKLVEASLLRTGMFMLGSDLGTQLHFGRLSSTQPRAETADAIRNFYKTSDDHWLMLIPRGNKTDFRTICKVVGYPDLPDDPRFKTPVDRKENAAEMVALFDESFAKKTLEEWSATLDEADLVWGPVQHPSQVVEDPQAWAAGAFVDIPNGDNKPMTTVASPIRFNGVDVKIERPTPEVGEHTAEVLAGLGYTESDIEKLIEVKVIR